MSQIYPIIITPAAQQALEAAYHWIEERAPERAKAWANGFMEAIDSLAMLPTRCALAPETVFFDEEVRQLLYSKSGHRYRILFTIRRDVVIVLFIRHAAQDWIQPTTPPPDAE